MLEPMIASVPSVAPDTAAAASTTDSDGRIRVAVLYGGRSSEHAISCVSAGAVLEHLDPARYEVVPIGITRAGVWTLGGDPASLKIQDRQLPEVDGSNPEVYLAVNPQHRGQIRRVSGELVSTVDVVLPILHGRFGEDGTIQGLFELSGVPYVGPGVLASASGQDKVCTRNLLRQAGLPLGKEVVLGPGAQLTAAQQEELGLPVFVKPARGGSSIGVSRVTSWEDLDQAVATARAEDDQVLVEEEIRGVEVECGILELPDGSLQASVPAQLIDVAAGSEGFYGFDTKYLDDVVSAQIPADLSAEATAEIQELAKKAFRALGCTGISRVDFFYTEHGPMLNEINTMPGFTPISMYPKVFAHSGVDYAQLLDTLIQTALAAPTAKH